MGPTFFKCFLLVNVIIGWIGNVKSLVLGIKSKLDNGLNAFS